MPASTNALVERASAASSAAVDAEPAAGKTIARAITVTFLVADAAGNASIATAGVANATRLSVAGGVAVAAAGGAALAAGRAAVAAA